MSRVMHGSQVKYLLFKYKQIYKFIYIYKQIHKFVVSITQQVNLFFRIVEYLIKHGLWNQIRLGLS